MSHAETYPDTDHMEILVQRNSEPVRPPAQKVTLPTQSLLKGKPYTNSASTNIRALFDLIRAQLKGETA